MTGAIRFAAGNPDGLRSLTWSVKGRTNKQGQDDFYIGTRQTMDQIKLTLHQADAQGRQAVSIFAYTKEAPKPEPYREDRAVFRMDEAIEFAPGWRQAAVIMTPSFTFGSFSEKPVSKGESIRWFVAPPLPEQLEFYVVVGEVGRCDLPSLTGFVDGRMEEVGQMELGNGRVAMVVANAVSKDARYAAIVRGDLEKAVNTPGAFPFSHAQHGNGFTYFLDLTASLTPQTSQDDASIAGA